MNLIGSAVLVIEMFPVMYVICLITSFTSPLYGIFYILVLPKGRARKSSLLSVDITQVLLQYSELLNHNL